MGFKIMLNFDSEIIKSIKNLNGQELRYIDSDFHIIYGADEGFLYGTGISIVSVVINNPHLNFHFHIFSDYISEESVELFVELIRRHNIKITFYDLNSDYLKKLNIDSKSWNDSIYFRLIGVDYLLTKVERVLYLDSDIICKNNIIDLVNIDFDGCSLIAVHDRLLHPENKNYFNSGFLYFNSSRMLNKNITKLVISLVKENNFTHPDQDALNVIFDGDVKIISREYNDFYNIDSSIRKNNELSEISEHTVFIHYVGITKPWHDWYRNTNETDFFEKARVQSGWSNELLKPASTYKQMSRKYSHLKYRGKFGLAFFYYLKYLKMKMKHKKNKQ